LLHATVGLIFTQEWLEQSIARKQKLPESDFDIDRKPAPSNVKEEVNPFMFLPVQLLSENSIT
jgi:hypothetical protein